MPSLDRGGVNLWSEEAQAASRLKLSTGPQQEALMMRGVLTLVGAAANDGSRFGLAERTAVRRPRGRASTRRPPARLKVSVLMVPAPERVVLRLAGARHGQVMSST
jgi:hypothetical protein